VGIVRDIYVRKNYDLNQEISVTYEKRKRYTGRVKSSKTVNTNIRTQLMVERIGIVVLAAIGVFFFFIFKR